MQEKSDVDLRKFTPEQLCKIFRTAWRHGELGPMRTLLVELEERNANGLADEVSFFRGLIAKYENRLTDAIAAFNTSLNLNHKRHDSAIELAALKCHRFDFKDAYQLINDCTGDFSKSPVYLNMAGECLVTLGFPDKALPYFERAQHLQPEITDFTMNLASCLSFVGRSSQATELLDGLLRSGKDVPSRALYQLSGLDPQRLEPFFNGTVKTAKPADRGVGRGMMLHAKARLSEVKGDMDDAWSLYEQAGEALNSVAPEEPRSEVMLLNEMMNLASTTDWSLIPSAPVSGKDTTMIFVLGLPRSGTTLVEKILSAHPDVNSVGETNLIARSILKATGRNAANDRISGDALTEILLTHPQAIRQNYLTNIQYLSKDAPYTVEKQPLNTTFFPILLKAFPDAHFIFTERHPMATAFSMFKQLFSQAYFSTNRLSDLNVYLKVHHSMMEVWRERFPGQITEVTYEALVSSPETAIKTLMTALGLTDHPNVYEHHRHFSHSMTASSRQVQQGIYDSANLAWQKHEEKLKAKLSL
jgi:hypothetical protein